MGIQPTPGLTAALFSPVQQRLVGLLFAQPERRFQGAELIRLVGSGTGAVMRQLARLVDSRLVNSISDGGRKYYQANPDSPIFAELNGIALKTAGLAEPLREALAPLADRITMAFVYGSLARGSDHGGSDIDLMVISDRLAYGDIFAAVHSVEGMLGRRINPTVMSPDDWNRKKGEPESFVQRVSEAPRIMLIGGTDGFE